MTDNFYLALAAILIFPLIPAFFIYKYLPVGKGDDVDVSGPFSGLSLKLKGAFAMATVLSRALLLISIGFLIRISCLVSSKETANLSISGWFSSRFKLITLNPVAEL